MAKSLDTSIKTLHDVEYEIKLLNTSEAYLTFHELIKIVLPSAGAGADGLFNRDSWDDSDTFQTVAYTLLNQLDKVNTLSIIKKLLAESTADGELIDFDEYFKGRLHHLISVLEFVLQENYGSLFMDTDLKTRLTTFTSGLMTQIQEAQPLEESEKVLSEKQSSPITTDSSST